MEMGAKEKVTDFCLFYGSHVNLLLIVISCRLLD
jgi:hypothetical protein